MSGGIETKAVYTVVCDNCGVRAEPKTEYRSRSEALGARRRVSENDGWLLRWISSFPSLLCPECASDEAILPH
jgi:hypothetical protein